MRIPRPSPRKLLVASVGVATVTYAAVTGALSACGGATARIGDAGSPPEAGGTTDAADAADDLVVGNLAPSPCVPDPTVVCPPVAQAFACSGGGGPELVDPTLACANPSVTDATGDTTTCCIDWPPSAQCAAVGGATAFCPQPGSWTFQCVGGAAPVSTAGSLACGAPTADADGVHDDYCCTLE